MRISDIKALCSDTKAKRLFSYFWETEDYCHAMSAYKNDSATAFDIFNIIADVLFRRMDEYGIRYTDNEREDIRRLSKILYGDPYHWTIGTKWAYMRENYDRMLEIMEADADRYEKLLPLCERLSLEPGGKKDLMKRISRDEALFNAVMADFDSITDVGALYRKLYAVAIPLIEADEHSYHVYSAICTVSYLAYGSESHWAEESGLSFEKAGEKKFRN